MGAIGATATALRLRRLPRGGPRGQHPDPSYDRAGHQEEQRRSGRSPASQVQRKGRSWERHGKDIGEVDEHPLIGVRPQLETMIHQLDEVHCLVISIGNSQAWVYRVDSRVDLHFCTPAAKPLSGTPRPKKEPEKPPPAPVRFPYIRFVVAALAGHHTAGPNGGWGWWVLFKLQFDHSSAICQINQCGSSCIQSPNS